MRTIQLYGLGRQYAALVDDADYDRVSVHKWFVYKARGQMYAMRQTGSSRNGTKQVFYLHREVMRAEPRQQIDHKDGDGLNCQRPTSAFLRSNRTSSIVGVPLVLSFCIVESQSRLDKRRSWRGLV